MKPAANIIMAVLQLCEQQQAAMRAWAEKSGTLHVRDDGVEIMELGDDIVQIGAPDFVLVEAVKSLRDLNYKLHAADIAPVWARFCDGEIEPVDETLLAELDRQLTTAYRRD
jgi:hypothetical protein